MAGADEDAGGEDAAEGDGVDAGGEDAGGEDAGGEDAGGEDAGGEDAGGEDAEGEDAEGEDAGGDDLVGEGDGDVTGPGDVGDRSAGGPVDATPKSLSNGEGRETPSPGTAGVNPGAGEGVGPRATAVGTPVGARVEPLDPADPASGGRRSTAAGAGS